MNPLLNQLQAYPFERLARLKQGVTPPASLAPVTLSIGEPQHPTPAFIGEQLVAYLSGLNAYPVTRGLPALRTNIAQWLTARFKLPSDAIDPERHLLPCNGTREALFAFAQCVIDGSRRPLVAMPNPFYQIYEGAALLAGAEPYFLNTTRETGYLPDFDAVPASVWARCQLLYICSPGNPTGTVLTSEVHRKLLELSDRYGFVIASDECYSELYADESAPPPGLLESAYALGNRNFKGCVVFHSLSKRSNAPGLRSGFVAGDAEILARFQLYRTYHGCAMPVPTQHASIAAWRDETHVVANRAQYREKFAAVRAVLDGVWNCAIPPAGFYFWQPTPIDDQEFARRVFAEQHVTVLPGSYLSREAHGCNPGQDHVRIALVAPLAECVAAAERIRDFLKNL